MLHFSPSLYDKMQTSIWLRWGRHTHENKITTFKIISFDLSVLFTSFILSCLWVIAACALIFGWTASIFDLLRFFYCFLRILSHFGAYYLFGICLNQNGNRIKICYKNFRLLIFSFFWRRNELACLGSWQFLFLFFIFHWSLIDCGISVCCITEVQTL